MDKNFSIGKRVKELRIENHLSQEQLAFAADITTAYLGQIERNEKNPTILVVSKICDALAIELSEFFSNESIPEQKVDTVTIQILNQLKDQDEEDKVIILQLIKQALKLKKDKN